MTALYVPSLLDCGRCRANYLSGLDCLMCHICSTVLHPSVDRESEREKQTDSEQVCEREKQRDAERGSECVCERE